jgi:hypothetical protein
VVEQGRFSSIRVANQRDDRIRHAPARLSVQGPRPLDRFELALEPRNPLTDQPSV